MFKLRKKILKIEKSLSRSRDLHHATLFSRDTCDAEVIGIISLKAHSSSLNSSHENMIGTPSSNSKKKESKRRGHQLTSILHLSITSSRTKERRHLCSTLLPFMLFFAKTCSKASPSRTLVCALSVQL
ncbi:hypothetical protein AVEN_165983-1 [Araneus ventricosus]|uniref:Uncharacterized protein n=1 Tax=Araneus ventricosus TaxID=182803 RepID=A0A4Y2ACB5_ARAVE|nr:hypothetical protein AVEN_196074-1 [Araneus ventricosus]GBL76866.1 hypothetical protein AVEN_165983-1 [Araneus ventricosus]